MFDAPLGEREGGFRIPARVLLDSIPPPPPYASPPPIIPPFSGKEMLLTNRDGRGRKCNSSFVPSPRKERDAAAASSHTTFLSRQGRARARRGPHDEEDEREKFQIVPLLPYDSPSSFFFLRGSSSPKRRRRPHAAPPIDLSVASYRGFFLLNPFCPSNFSQ